MHQELHNTSNTSEPESKPDNSAVVILIEHVHDELSKIAASEDERYEDGFLDGINIFCSEMKRRLAEK